MGSWRVVRAVLRCTMPARLPCPLTRSATHARVLLQLGDRLQELSLVEVVSGRRHEWRNHLTLRQILPFEVTEPNVVLELARSIETQPLRQLSLDALVDEVGRHVVPILWCVRFFERRLPHNQILLVTISRVCRPRFTFLHDLVADDADLKVVSSRAIILSEHGLRRQITWMTGRI